MRKKPRRILAGVLIVVGAGMMLLAPESPGGAVALAAGIVVELIGIALEHQKG